MGQVYVPKCQNQQILVGNVASSIVSTSPLILIKINGVIYANGDRFDTTGGYRNLYGSYDASTGNVYLNSYTFATSGTVPEVSFSGVEVLLIG